MPPEALILSIETATRGGSLCLMQDNQLLASATGDPQASHSNTLLRDVNQVLEKSSCLLEDLTLLAIASGPGSFTGLRIGLASVKALAVTLNIPCIGVPTLHAVAHAGGPSAASVALLPAGRGEWFAQLLSVNDDGTVRELEEPVHVPPQELLRKYRHLPTIRWCGEEAIGRREEIQKFAWDEGIEFFAGPAAGQSGWTLAPAEPLLARHVAALAWGRFREGEKGDPASLMALYVRPSDAELKINVQNQSGH